MNSLPEYLQQYYLSLSKVFPSGVSQDEMLIVIFLLRKNFSQRNLAMLLSKCSGMDYFKLLNIINDRQTNDQLDPNRKVEIKTKLANAGFDID